MAQTATNRGDAQDGIIPMGMNGRKVQWGQASFPTTGATATLSTHMHVVEVVIPIPIGAPATDETLFWGDTVPSSGAFVVPANGQITIGRTGAAKTSNLPFSYLIIGR